MNYIRTMVGTCVLTLILPGAVLWAGGSEEGTAAAGDQSMPAAASGGTYSEAPMLARMVAAGELPPVDERLPDIPVVAGPGVLNGTQYLDWKPGKYSDGRTLRTVALSTKVSILDISTNNFLWAPEQRTKDMIPVLLEDFSTADDHRVFNFTIRKGLKWSNGDPVTTEDVRFTFEDLYGCEECSIVPRNNLHSQGNRLYPMGEVEILDDYSFRITFDRPYGFFVADLRSWITDSTMIMRPSKFLKQFHPAYADQAKISAMAKEAGLVDWQQLLAIKGETHWQRSGRNRLTIGVPHFQAWGPTEITDTHTLVERNPYYNWVDTEGKQLPYIDRILSTKATDADAANVMILSGEIDYVLDDFVRLPGMPLYLEGAERAGYYVQTSGGFNSPPLLFINQDYDYENPDSQWQVLVQDPERRFGQAVALAIDKHDINESLYFGRYHMDDLVTSIDYDPELANQLLDELGMSERDARGFRTYPDGSRFEFSIVTNGLSPDQIDLSQLVAQFLHAVGINASAKQVAPQIWREELLNNEYPMTVMWNDIPGHPSGISQDYWPRAKGAWAPASALYAETAGERGRQPPPYMQEFFDIHTARKAVPPESPEGAELWRQLLDYFARNYVMIWPVGSIVQPNIFSRELRNVPGDGYPIIFGMTEAAPQWYFES